MRDWALITALLVRFDVIETSFLAAFFHGGLLPDLFRGVVAGAFSGGLIGGIAGFVGWRQVAPTASKRAIARGRGRRPRTGTRSAPHS